MTGNAMKDHTDHVLWLGPSESLNLAALSRS
jgi:aromatic ring-cleaving dioxygenase